MALTPELALFSAAGALFVGLGLVALWLRWRHATAVALGACFLGIGGVYLAQVLSGGREAASLAVVFARVLLVLGLAGLVYLFPSRVQRRDARAFLACIAYAAGVVALAVSWGDLATLSTISALATVIDAFGATIVVAAIAWFALVARRLPSGAISIARSLSLLCIGFSLLIVGNVDVIGEVARGEADVRRLALAAAVGPVPIFLWALAATGAHARVARNTAVAWSAIYVAGLLLSPGREELIWGIGRLLGALFLGYAVLRGLIEGLDLKVRFAISKSAVAAVFLVAFFVVAQVAQEWFGSSYGPVFGGITAGLMLFAIAPIQRVAERLASAAVPTVGAAPGPAPAPAPADAQTGGRGEGSYRKAVRLALRDRRLSREEEGHLHELARDLGIDGVRAHQILVEVESESGVVR